MIVCIGAYGTYLSNITTQKKINTFFAQYHFGFIHLSLKPQELHLFSLSGAFESTIQNLSVSSEPAVQRKISSGDCFMVKILL